jgi:hypothetical protein
MELFDLFLSNWPDREETGFGWGIEPTFVFPTGSVVIGETICMAVSVYLLIGFTFALLCGIIVQLHLESFGGRASANSIQSIVPVLGYFSLTTLSTIGFGDLTPSTIQARYAAVAEGITCQFYMAILVARLVRMQ